MGVWERFEKGALNFEQTVLMTHVSDRAYAEAIAKRAPSNRLEPARVSLDCWTPTGMLVDAFDLLAADKMLGIQPGNLFPSFDECGHIRPISCRITVFFIE